MEELFIRNNELIAEKEWKELVNGLKVEDIIDEKPKAIQLIKQELTKAIKLRGNDKFGVLFSGGIDSVMIALILKKAGCDFNCYSVGLEKSKDLVWAKDVAEDLGFNLRLKILSLEEVEHTVKKVAKILKGFDYVNVSVGCVLYEAINLAKHNGNKAVFTGLGAEEVFAGYHKHTKVKDINSECWKGLKGIWKQDLKRDYAISKALQVEMRTPFLDQELIKVGMMVPGEFKISKGYKKMILRDVALDLDLEKKYAMRKKLAAQYGSRMDKAIKKIAKSHGFKNKSDYVKSLQ